MASKSNTQHNILGHSKDVQLFYCPSSLPKILAQLRLEKIQKLEANAPNNNSDHEINVKSLKRTEKNLFRSDVGGLSLFFCLQKVQLLSNKHSECFKKKSCLY